VSTLGAPAATAPARQRVASIDVVRGAVMVLMALDHVRDYVTNLRVRPEDLAAHGSVALFATRWLTHFCAPAFSLLAGLGIGLAMNRGRSARDMSKYLVTRGLWLIVLDLVITPVGWQFGFRLIPAFALVLWALGLSMIVMAALVRLPRAVVAVVALLMIALHNLTDSVTPESWGAFAWAWHILHVPGFAIPGKLFIAYPLIPWVAVMALGWTLAQAYHWNAGQRRALFVNAGVVATITFVVLRAINGYGDPRPWSTQATPALTVASFFNVTKYPPSLDFLLMTVGPTLVVLALVQAARGPIARWLAVYGRVPLFYYVVHIFLAHAVAVALAFAQGRELRRILVVTDPASIPAWYGVGLPGVYVAWALVVLVMYPLCRMYGRIKQERQDWWLGYL